MLSLDVIPVAKRTLSPMDAKPTIRTFLRALFANWFTAMSGPLSVPCAIAAFFVPSPMAQFGLGVTAIAYFGFTGYWVWTTERVKLVDVQAQLWEIALDHPLHV